MMDPVRMQKGPDLPSRPFQQGKIVQLHMSCQGIFGGTDRPFVKAEHGKK